jgi:hypothetical protein
MTSWNLVGFVGLAQTPTVIGRASGPSAAGAAGVDVEAMHSP